MTDRYETAEPWEEIEMLRESQLRRDEERNMTDPTDEELLQSVKLNQMSREQGIHRLSRELAELDRQVNWQPMDNKPANLPGEYHSRTVLLFYKERYRAYYEHPYALGHVSNGHWRPQGGNGNFDDCFSGWMDLPEGPK